MLNEKEQAFLQFCKSKPADLEYDSGNVNRCALGQFGEAVTILSHERHGISDDVYHAAVRMRPSTFGALAERLEALAWKHS